MLAFMLLGVSVPQDGSARGRAMEFVCDGSVARPVAPAPAAEDGPSTGTEHLVACVPVASDASATGDAGAQTAAEVVVTARRRPPPGDPLRGVNATSFRLTQAADGAVVGPLTRLYERGIPPPVRDGISNVLYNLREPIVAINYAVQLKPGKAAETVGRLIVNSTLGIAGIVDVAKRDPFRLPRRRNGFANTLGFYGAKPGPFLFLPLVGPTTLRDLVGDIVDRSALPLIVRGPFRSPAFTVPAAVFGALERRSELEPELEAISGSADPYAARRDRYLDRRRREIEALRGGGGAERSPSGGLGPGQGARSEVPVPGRRGPDAGPTTTPGTSSRPGSGRSLPPTGQATSS